MFISFLRPVKYEFVFYFVIIAALLGTGRFFALDGGLWTWFAVLVSALVFADAGRHWSGLHALDIPARNWIKGALGTSLLWSVLMATIATIAAVLMQRNSPYYTIYDWFLNTSGPVEHIDTNGAAYVLDDGATPATSVLWTLLITFAVFLVFIIVGLAIGVSIRHWPRLITIAASVIVGIIVLGAFAYYLAYLAQVRAVEDEWFIPITLDSWQRLGIVLASGATPMLVGWWAIRRSLQSPWD